MGFLNEWNGLLMKIILNPEEFFSTMKKDDKVYGAVRFALLNVMITAIFGYWFSYFTGNPNLLALMSRVQLNVMGFFIVYFFMVSFSAILGLVVISAFAFLFLRLFGVKDKFGKMMRVFCYSTAPMVFSWIPVVSMFVILYMGVTQIVGMSKVYKVSVFKASVVMYLVLLSIVIFVFLPYVSLIDLPVVE